MNLIIAILLLLGSAFLLIALVPVTKIIKHPAASSKVKNYWKILFVLICAFFTGYGVYARYLSWENSGIIDLIVPTIFFFGAIFVLLVTYLALETTQDLERTFKWEQISNTDSLLEVYNRRYLDRRLMEEFSSARRYKHDLSFLMIDLDHFKKINDLWGHQIGDKVLKDVCSLIKKSLRETDILCRYGGEEFCLVLPHTDKKAALHKAEQIRKEIENSSIHSQKVCVSIGVSSVSNALNSAEDLIWQADMALYHAKKTGRNRSLVYCPTYTKDSKQNQINGNPNTLSLVKT